MRRIYTGVKTGYLAVILAMTALVVFASGQVSAVGIGGGNVQSYSAPRNLDHGTVVELDSSDAKNPNKVTVAAQDRLQNMFGVTVDQSQLSVTLSHSGRKHQVYVASSGTYRTLVSTQNGPIESGDYVTLSALDGILMKADTKQETVFGRAAGSFNDKSVSVGGPSLKDDQGGSRSVKLGLIPVTIDIKRNPNIESTKVKVPEYLESLGQQIAKKEVSPIRIYLSLGITAVSLITAIVVLYAGVRNGVISIGRNPMSKKSIFRALLEIILTSVAVLMVGLFAVYLLLRL